MFRGVSWGWGNARGVASLFWGMPFSVGPFSLSLGPSPHTLLPVLQPPAPHRACFSLALRFLTSSQTHLGYLWPLAVV